MADAVRTDPAATHLAAPPRATGEPRKRLHLRPAASDTRIHAQGKSGGLSRVEIAALVFSLLWLGLAGWFLLTLPEDQARFTRSNPLALITTILGVFLPVALIWVAASTARTAQTMRDESARLRAAMDALRETHAASQQRDAAALTHEIDTRLAEVNHAQAVLAAELAALREPVEPAAVLSAPIRPAPVAPQQPTLALDTEPEAEPLPPEDFIRALNFPENERDLEGFDVLRHALRHHDTARLVNAAQDLLTLLAQDGIFMDDLTVHRADAVLWRAFADGVHGSGLAALGGIRDRSSLALTAGRMKDDPVFRDAVHHFLRTFDQVFSAFTRIATDGEIMSFSNTRTARAFMLCARVSGTFD